MIRRSAPAPTRLRVALIAGALAMAIGQVAFARRAGGGMALLAWVAGLITIVKISDSVVGARPGPPAELIRAGGDSATRRSDRPPLDSEHGWFLGGYSEISGGVGVSAGTGAGTGGWRPRSGWISPRTFVPALLTLILATGVFVVQRSRPPEQPRWDVVVLWILSMSTAVFTVWQPGERVGVRVRRSIARLRDDVTNHTLIAGLSALSFGLLLIELGSYPTTLNGDSAAFALLSRRVLHGEVDSPFGVGYLSHPILWNYVQAAGMWLVGDDLAGARFASAVAGAAATWSAGWIVLRLTGRRVSAAVAAILLATSFLQLYWMRSALPNGWTTAWILVVVLLLGRAIDRRSTPAMVAAGIAAGLGQYFYFSGRVLIPVVGAVCFISAVLDGRSTGGARAVGRAIVHRLTPVSVGFALAVLPQVAYYSVRPGDLDSRVRSTSVFNEGWLTTESQRTGDHPVVILARQFVDAALVPFRAVVPGHYRGDPPYVGWIVALLGAVGLALVTARLLRGPLWSALALTYWATAAGTATTIEPTQSSRAVTLVVLTCIFAALGLDLLARTAVELALAPRRVVAAGAAMVVGVAAMLGVHRHFRSPDQVDVYADPNTEVVDTLARDLADDPAGTTVYFAGAPRIWYHGFSNFAFRAPQVVGIDIEDPAGFWVAPHEITGPTRFVVLPERNAQLDMVSQRYPGGRRVDVVGHDGRVLYEEYRISDPISGVGATADPTAG